MPFTPLTATERFVVQYAVDSFPHRWEGYCSLATIIAGVPQIRQRDGVSTIPAPDAIQRWWNLAAACFPNSTPTPTVLFEQRSGSVWLPIAGITLSGATGTGVSSHASQYTLVVRSSTFTKIRVVLMEHNAGYVGHSDSGVGISSELDAFANDYTPTADANGAYFWQKSRGDEFILESGAIAGATLDLNDKIKRRRGFE